MTTHQVAHLLRSYQQNLRQSYLSSDSDFEDKSAVSRKRKKQISNSSKFESDDNSSDAHVCNGHRTNISSAWVH